MSVSHSLKLSTVIEAARRAVLSGSVQPQDEKGVTQGYAPQHEQVRNQVQVPAPVPLKVPRHVQRPTEAPRARVLATMPSAATLRAGVPFLTRGAARLFELLVRLAGDVARHRAHEQLPAALTFHLPAVGLAVYLGFTERYIAMLAAELEGHGLIAFGAHAVRVAGRSMWTGTLWKVATVPGHVPRINREEWAFPWRPDFEADYTGKTGVKAEISGLVIHDRQGAYQQLVHRAAVQLSKNFPVGDRPENRAGTGLDAVAAQVRGLAYLHHSRRDNAITATAQALASSLNEPHRRAQWAGAIWAALKAHWEGRGDLEHMASQVLRLKADIAEQAPFRSFGAILMARL